jgi:alpha-glucosidase
MFYPLALCLLMACAAWAQNEVRVSSPSGQVEMIVGVAKPPVPGSLEGLAYQVRYGGDLLIDTSYLGFEIYHQAPLLGERVGLVAARKETGDVYNSVIPEYMQNGSLGRRITVEARAYDDGVAFRYLIPRSAPLESLLIQNEITEFRFSSRIDLDAIASGTESAMPFAAKLPGGSWIGIASSAPASVGHYEGSALVTRLPHLADRPLLAVETKTPWTSPWRVLIVAGTREAALESSTARARLLLAVP